MLIVGVAFAALPLYHLSLRIRESSNARRAKGFGTGIGVAVVAYHNFERKRKASPAASPPGIWDDEFDRG
jgi:hypothetical protein